MNEMKLASWCFEPGATIASTPGSAAMSQIDLSSHPDLVEHLADWTPVSHTLSQLDTGALVLTVLLYRVVEPPDNPGSVGDLLH